MEVVIAGAGSIGLLLGSYFCEAGMNVTFLVRSDAQKKTLNRDGLRRINIDRSESECRVDAIMKIEEAPVKALWILAVKYAALEGLLEELENAAMTNPVLFIQNGIGHIELARRSYLPTISLATVEHGAMRIDNRTVQHNGSGTISIAPFRGEQFVFQNLHSAQTKEFPITYVNDAEQIMLRKVLLNCMINPLTALLQLKNGELLSNPYGYELLVRLHKELLHVFPEMTRSLPLEAVERICKKTATNHSSMLVDRLSRKQMEIETIVTAVIQEATVRGSTLPTLVMLEQLLLALDWSREQE